VLIIIHDIRIKDLFWSNVDAQPNAYIAVIIPCDKVAILGFRIFSLSENFVAFVSGVWLFGINIHLRCKDIKYC
jgi:hypothetical protein